MSDLVPYWRMPVGQARSERFVPFLPMSRETTRLGRLLKILSLYRLAFGQPRQQELLKLTTRNNHKKKALAHRSFQLVMAPPSGRQLVDTENDAFVTAM